MSKLPKLAHTSSSRFYYKLFFFLPVDWGTEVLDGKPGEWMSTCWNGSNGKEELTFEQMVEYRSKLIEGGYVTRAYSHRIMETMDFMPDESIAGAIEWEQRWNDKDARDR